MASVASGLTSAQSEPRTLPLYLPFSSRRAKSATRPRYCQTSEVTLGIGVRRPASCSAAARPLGTARPRDGADPAWQAIYPPVLRPPRRELERMRTGVHAGAGGSG